MGSKIQALRCFAVLENSVVLTLLVISSTFFKGEISEMDCCCFKKKARKTVG